MSVTFPRMAPWQGAQTCTGKVTPGARAMMAFWLESYEPIAKSLGIYNCRTVRGGSTTSLHGEGRACDLGVPVTTEGHAVMYEFLRRLAPHAYRLGIQLAIFDRKIWSAKSLGGRYYGGVHPHRDHTHLELSWSAANKLTLATLRSVVGGTTSKEDDVYVVKNGQSGPRVTRAQVILKAAGEAAGAGNLLPKYGADGDYGDETVAAVNAMAKRAKLPQDGKTGMDVLVLDYCRMQLEASRRGGGGGLSQAEADKRYVRKGTTVETTGKL